MTDFGRKHAPTHEDGGSDEIDLTGLEGGGGGSAYVDRGDHTDWDFDGTNLTRDGSWYDMNLSSVVPVGAICVHIIGKFKSSEVDKLLKFRVYGHTDPYTDRRTRTQVANIHNGFSFLFSLDSNRIVQYNIESANWTDLAFTVVGWFK